MAKVVLSTRAVADLERLAAFLRDLDEDGARATPTLIVEALRALAHHPLLGRRVEAGFRELVISRGSSGYVALYAFEEDEDVVQVLALRHQREAGYPRRDP